MLFFLQYALSHYQDRVQNSEFILALYALFRFVLSAMNLY